MNKLIAIVLNHLATQVIKECLNKHTYSSKERDRHIPMLERAIRTLKRIPYNFEDRDGRIKDDWIKKAQELRYYLISADEEAWTNICSSKYINDMLDRWEKAYYKKN